MDDIGERPSKFRKLDTSEDTAENVIKNESMDNPAELTSPPSVKEEEQEEDPLASIDAPATSAVAPPPSKSQQKKLIKQAAWEAGKDYRKAKRKELHKAKVARKAEARQELEEKIAKGEIEAPVVPKKQFRRPMQVPITFLIDCDFDEYMAEKEIVSLSAQLTRCYSDNKSNQYRTHLVMSSWGGRLKTRFEIVLANTHLGWKGVKYLDSDFVTAAAEMHDIMKGPEGGKLAGALAGEGEGTSEVKIITEAHQEVTSEISDEALSAQEPSIVYLSSDSPNTLDRLSPNTTYVVGGIVDKNRYKGLCYHRACARGIQTAKLPIGEYMTMQSRTVLTVNHVVEIMLKWLETGDWGDAFLAVIPKRKEAKLRVKRDEEEDESENEGNGEEEDGEQVS